MKNRKEYPNQIRRARNSTSSGFTLIEIMLSGLILSAVSLGLAELIAGMMKSSKYSRAYNMRTALENTLKSAVLSPRMLCKSLNKAVKDSSGVPYNQDVTGNEAYSTCVTGTKFPALGIARCHSINAATIPNKKYDKQHFSIWDEAGEKKISGGIGQKNPTTPATSEDPVYYDISGKQCDASIAPTDGTPDAKCPYKVTSWFWPVCPGNAPSCDIADSVLIHYQLDVSEKIQGGAPLGSSENTFTSIPVETWRIASACRVSDQPNPVCPLGQYMTGTRVDGMPKCGILPNNSLTGGSRYCPYSGQIVTGFVMRRTSGAQPQDRLEPLCKCVPGTYLANYQGACQCAPSEGPQNEPPRFFHAATNFAKSSNTRFDGTAGNLDFEWAKVEASGSLPPPPGPLAPPCPAGGGG